jgi:hypothetical protein
MSIVVRSVPRRAVLATAALVLAGAVGVLGAGGAAAGTSACGGTQGQPVLLGCGSNTSTATTVITVPGDDLSGLWVSETGARSWGIRADGTDRGVSGSGLFGVYGTGANAGVYGTSASYGVQGEGDGTGVVGGGNTGVAGTGNYGVVGVGATEGVNGFSVNGTGVRADSGNGTALRVTGRSKFSTAGTAVVPSGQKKVTVTLAGVASTDFVLATVQGSGGFYVKNAVAGTGQFTIAINKAPASPATVTVAYFVISAS